MIVLTSRGFRRAREGDYLEAIKALLLLIPIGKVVSYDDIARLLGLHPRVLGRILAKNEDAPIVPCHRVVRKSGGLGGYSIHGGVRVKKRLLELEGVRLDARGRVRPECFVSLRKKLL
uniref:MGMT family protein n=1 Tax=Fervidicoccus fontis TaxID=683846 RepID=A0A7J3ZLB8_9CREN